jgi:hypothetical protein
MDLIDEIVSLSLIQFHVPFFNDTKIVHEMLSNLYFIHESSSMKINDKVISFIFINSRICLKFPWLFNGDLYMYKCYGSFGLMVKLVSQCVTR